MPRFSTAILSLLSGNLRFLTLLDIGFNSFSGFVPSSLCALADKVNASVYICASTAVNSSEGCGAISAVPSCLFPNSPNHRIGNLTEYFDAVSSTRPFVSPTSAAPSQNYSMCSLAWAWNVSGWDCSAGYPTDVCSNWPGVGCNGTHVVSISLVYYGIRGIIPSSLGLEY